MSAMSDYLEAALLNHIFRSATFSKPSNMAIALTTGIPLDAHTGSYTSPTLPEVSGGSYTRYTALTVNDAHWNAPSDSAGGKLIDNVSGLTWPTATANWDTISGVALVDNNATAPQGGGNVLLHGQLTTPKLVQNGDTFKFNAGDLDITFA